MCMVTAIATANRIRAIHMFSMRMAEMLIVIHNVVIANSFVFMGMPLPSL